MGGYKEYETYGASTLNECPPFILPDPTNPKSKSSNNRQNTSKRGRFA
ncbi:hypothetical protein EV09_1846 [Prochlorococcus marinus str. SS35]|nr:hypothetical protein EV09_1846 [Prochlorococcus marinus str. SS35]